MERPPILCHPLVLASAGQPTPKPSEMGRPNIRTLWCGHLEPHGLCPGLGHLLVLVISASLGLLSAFAE